MDYRSGYYCDYDTISCQMLGSDKGFYLIAYDKSAVRSGFESRDGFFEKKITRRDPSVNSAYIVRTKAMYKGFTFTIFQNEKLRANHKVRLNLNNLDFDAYDHFGFPYRNDDASIEVKEEELEEIWEERERLAQFRFKVDKIKHIKKRSTPPVFEKECKHLIHEGVPDEKTKKNSDDGFFGTWKSALVLAVLAGYNIIRGIANENYYNVIIGIVLLIGWLIFALARKNK
ncbi:hypothetical protein [Maribacter polysiphoniae]|uniref:hypothetical protein n=1 Tax=Maribacter polysiphoniae TaxID=429344 RepID=UPI002352008C|nr:hypothetical protein [Maribacter polysiphoniae]